MKYLIKIISIQRNKETNRTSKVLSNVIRSSFAKVGNILIGLFLIPITIDYISTEKYGVWLTIFSVVSWMSYMDIGLSSGLRNNLTVAIANDDITTARKLVSTTYVLLFCISATMLVLFLFTNQYIKWNVVFNVKGVDYFDLSCSISIVFCSFFIQFIVQILKTILIANHKVGIVDIISFITQVVILIVILVLKSFFPGSLVSLVLALTIPPIIVLLISSFYFYLTEFKRISPSLKYLDFSLTNRLFALGIKFFIIQIGVILFYNVNNFLISNISGPSAVTEYNIAFKYFSVITMGSSIIMAPLWSAFAEAHAQGEIEWIKKTVYKMERICIIVTLISLIMLTSSSIIYRIWIGNQVHIPITLSAILAVYTVVNTYRTIFNSYINGLSKTTLQLILILSAGIVNVPLGFMFGKRWGSTGVILATTILCIISLYFEKRQFNKLINNTAVGIWNS